MAGFPGNFFLLRVGFWHVGCPLSGTGPISPSLATPSCGSPDRQRSGTLEVRPCGAAVGGGRARTGEEDDIEEKPWMSRVPGATVWVVTGNRPAAERLAPEAGGSNQTERKRQ